MSLRKGLVRFVVVTAPFVFFSVATQARAQSQDENATAIAPRYKTISIKPSKSRIAGGDTKIGPDVLTATNETLQALIEQAYEVHDDQIAGVPIWQNSQRYDIEAKADNPAAGEGGERMLERGLLSDTFKLAVHRETRLIPVYELTVGDGPKLRESAPDYEDSHLRVIHVERGRIVGTEVPIATLARILSEELGRPVLDKTQLRCHYDVTLQWQTAAESSEPAILSAIQEQLGLKLVPTQLMFEDLIPGYELVIAKDGTKLQESASAFADSAPPAIQVESGRIMGREVPIATLARILSAQLGRPVLDKTQLSSHYDLTLQWPTAPDSSETPQILNAIQEQLGLKLKPQLMPKEFLVIDHVEMPSAD
jgi:uncharacterized protein (TIGR03435 family)